MDFLPIQVSSVPCERVFSSAAETDTKKRNRISPALMEALQMLKFLLKKKRLDFTAGWKTSEVAMLGLEGTKTEEGSQPGLDSLLGGDIEAARDELLGDDMKNYDA
jgi:hAT family C-terminal dimerisation region